MLHGSTTIAVTVLALALAAPAQGKGGGKGRPKAGGGKPGVEVRVKPGRAVTPGQVKKAVRHGDWKLGHPKLAAELAKLPAVHAHLAAHPYLFARLRVDVDRDGDGVLIAAERAHLIALLQQDLAAVPPGHRKGKSWWKRHHPELIVTLGATPELSLHLEAHPALFVELVDRVDLDGNGVLVEAERKRFVVELREHHAAAVQARKAKDAGPPPGSGDRD